MSADEPRRMLLELLGEGGSQVEMPRSGVLTIGSMANKVGFHVSGQGVSDVHCAIGRAKGGGFALKDLGSEYGTWVNGERVTQAKLDVGDMILIGSRRLRVVDPAAPPPKSAAEPGQAAAIPAAAQLQPAAARPQPGATTNYEQTPLPKIPGYRIEKLLGRGGMGEVFLATQERLDRKVALKLLSSKLCADADFVRRFQAEARAAAALSHPNVVVVHDVGEESGRHYLSMEFMDKGNLEGSLARGGRMPWREVLGVLHDIASALVYAEARGIVHRDIKPANMMQGSAGTTKLADLGLATQIEAEASDSENGRIFGTPHFISPEQARGERVDGRADLYSLGATAYRLLSGRTPFEGASTRDILRGHFNDTPKSLLEIDAQIPPEIVRIVERLLQKKPDDRYPSASVLLAEVDRVRSSLLHGERQPSTTRRGTPKLAVLALLIVAAGGAAWWFTRDRGASNAGAPPRNGDNPSLVQGPGNEAAQPPDESGEPADPTLKPPRDEDDDTKLKLLETSAKLAWKELPTDLAPAERATRLLALASEYAGTGAAVDMQAEADAITAALQQASAVEAELQARRQTALASLEAAAAPFVDSPARAFAAMNALAFDTQLLADEAFSKERLAHYRKVLAEGLSAATRANAEISASATRGDFADVRARIDALRPRLEPPLLPAGLDPGQLPDLDLLAALARDLSERGGGIDDERAQFLRQQIAADRGRVALGLGGASGMEAELEALDFAALAARLSKLESELATEPARNLVHELGADLARGQAALLSVARELAAGGWRRKQVADPRGGRAIARNALSADESGLTLEVDGKPESVPWSAFGAKPRELHLLFNERLGREYTREELLGIEALLRSAAVVAAIDAASEMLEPGSSARFDEGEMRELSEGFDWGRSWAAQSGVPQRFEMESRAAGLLARSLFDASEGSWSASVAGLDRLLEDYADTLLVRLLSNGSTSH